MIIRKIYYTSTFEKHFKKLPKPIKQLALKKEKSFKKNPTTPLLKTHALKGELKGFYSFSINYQYRIMFSFEAKYEVTFVDVGTHGIYK